MSLIRQSSEQAEVFASLTSGSGELGWQELHAYVRNDCDISVEAISDARLEALFREHARPVAHDSERHVMDGAAFARLLSLLEGGADADDRSSEASAESAGIPVTPDDDAEKQLPTFHNPLHSAGKQPVTLPRDDGSSTALHSSFASDSGTWLGWPMLNPRSVGRATAGTMSASPLMLLRLMALGYACFVVALNVTRDDDPRYWALHFAHVAFSAVVLYFATALFFSIVEHVREDQLADAEDGLGPLRLSWTPLRRACVALASISFCMSAVAAVGGWSGALERLGRAPMDLFCHANMFGGGLALVAMDMLLSDLRFAYKQAVLPLLAGVLFCAANGAYFTFMEPDAFPGTVDVQLNLREWRSLFIAGVGLLALPVFHAILTAACNAKLQAVLAWRDRHEGELSRARVSTYYDQENARAY